MALSVWKNLPKYWVTLLRSSFIGCWLGITPGGAIAASFMGYNLAKRFARDPESFGSYVFKKIGVPLAPFTLTLVLGNRAEEA